MALVLISNKLGFYKLRHLNGVVSLSIIFLIGGYITQIKHLSQNELFKADIIGFSGIIISPKTERTNYNRYVLELRHTLLKNGKILSSNGKIHLYIRKDSLVKDFQYGDHINAEGKYFELQKPSNPNEFNYKKYLRRQEIVAQAFVNTADVNLLKQTTPNVLIRWAYILKSKAIFVIDKNIPVERENGILKALLIGVKDHLDNEIKLAYSSAGAMHVLAVSGLHVGIIYMVIGLIFGFLKRIGNWGNFLFTSISLILIWFYALVTGLSPSVLRASTMFSLILISEAINRDSNIYNSLGLAAFILLLFNPYLIYSVGFQLSFAAVFGIVYLQPKFYQLIHPKYILFDKIWSITSVSIAAQLATFPLSAYYFHQFPTYFLISNIIVIPTSFIMLIGGLFMVLVDSIIPALGMLIGCILQKTLWLMNESIGYLQMLPNNIIEWIHLDQVELFLTYAIIVTFISALHNRSFPALAIASFLSCNLILWTVFTYEKQSHQNKLIFYKVSNGMAIDHISGHSSRLYVDDVLMNEIELLSYQINPSRLSQHLDPIAEDITPISNGYFVKKDVLRLGKIGPKRFVLFDSTTFHLNFNSMVETDIIYINNGAVKNLSWLQSQFNFELIVLGVNNSYTYSRKMKAQAEEIGLNLHSIREDGSFSIDL